MKEKSEKISNNYNNPLITLETKNGIIWQKRTEYSLMLR